MITVLNQMIQKALKTLWMVNVRIKIFRIKDSNLYLSLNNYKGFNRVRGRDNKGVRRIMSWAKFMREQSRMHKLFTEEPYIFHGIPNKKLNS